MTTAPLLPDGIAEACVVELDRAAITPWLPQLDAWLLPDSVYSVNHTWPQLYRSDGDGHFFGLLEDEQLQSHCAFRVVTVLGENGPFRAALLGSVATNPTQRGRGCASAVLGAALARADEVAEHVLLWAERPDLYARFGFAESGEETVLHLARLPRGDAAGVRLAEPRDHAALHALHEQKPWRVERSLRTMSGLLTTPGMTTVVLERAGEITAYACCGKGADLQGHWHEVGGSDTEIAALLPAGMHLSGQTEAFLLLPPYRPDLPGHLGRSLIGAVGVPGPMGRSQRGPLPACWIDGLDSV